MISALMSVATAFCAFIQWGEDALLPNNDSNKKEIKYVHNVKKQEEKEKFERKIMNRTPSGYMTVEEYELLSVPKDPAITEIEVPTIPTPADMVYVPKPTYRIVKYNNPVGGTEIILGDAFYKKRQQNIQGIVSPDFTKLVYPAVYYYPNNASTACDLFVINLDEAKSNKDKILTANVLHRVSEPILSTEKSVNNDYTFRTLTPVDFSSDGSKLLVKEKVGNNKDGIWKTTPIVYDFTNKISYNLVEVRGAIAYYWERYKSLDLDDKRWDVYPLGFDAENPDWVIVNAVAYTGSTPVNLGVWKVTYTGEQSRLVSFKNSAVNVSMNGFKLIKAGVEPSAITEKETSFLKKVEQEKVKQQKKDDKAEVKELEKSYKAKIKEMNAEYREARKDYDLRQRINSSTSGNEGIEKYKQIKTEQENKKEADLWAQKVKELKRVQKQRAKEEKVNQKQ